MLRAVSLALVAGAAAAAAAPRRELLRLSLGELQALRPEARAALRRALRREGAVLVTGVPGLDEAAEEALGAAGDCFALAGGKGDGAAGPLLSRLPGGASRATLATRTVAGAAEALPPWASERCPGLARPAAALRGYVGLLLSLFARSADAAAEAEGAAEGGQLRHTAAARSASRPSLEEVVRRGVLLEHFHSYRRPAPRGAAAALEMHTDAGMLQALTVRWRRASGSALADADGVGLEVQLPGGEVVPAEARGAGGAGVLLLVGQGTADWLPHLRFRAAPHALPLRGPADLERLVFGAMVLPPDDWPLAGPESNATFGEWWRRAQRAVTDGRAEEQDAGTSSPGCLSAPVLRRRLADLASACPAGSIYCWMQCQEVPRDLPCSEAHAVCISGQTGEVCPESGDGHTHDASCVPMCPKTSTQVLRVLGAGEGPVDGVYRVDSDAGGKASYLRKQDVDRAAPQPRIAWSSAYERWELFSPGVLNSSVLYFNEAVSSTPPTGGWETYSGRLPAPALRYVEAEAEAGGGGATASGKGDFCNGVLTDMHMLGYVWSGAEEPCLVFIFRGWELTDATKFYLALLGTVLAGVFAEFLISARRWKLWSRPQASAGQFWLERSLPAKARLRLSRAPLWLRRTLQPDWKVVGVLLLYAATRTVGYWIMLISMMYSVEMFIALIVGLTIGHATFNLSAAPGEDATPCCQAGGPGRAGRGGGKASLVAAERPAGEAGETVHLKVEGMTCGACETTVRNALSACEEVWGVQSCSHETGGVELVLRSSVPADVGADRARLAIDDVGFAASVVGAGAKGGLVQKAAGKSRIELSRPT